MERWHNRVAVVTGASSGIGAECSKLLVAKGMVVVGLARRQERMDELKASLPKDQQTRFHAMRCDVSSEEDIVGTFARIESKLGGVDVLVNNAPEFLLAETKIKITSVSPGAVDTEMIPTHLAEKVTILRPEDVADAIVYCIQTAPNVQIHELTIKRVGEMF